MDTISRVLARHTTGNLIVMDGPCLLGHRVKKGEYVHADSYVANYCAYIKLFQYTVLMDRFDRYDDNIAQHITINFIMTVGPCLATGMSSEKKAES